MRSTRTVTLYRGHGRASRARVSHSYSTRASVFVTSPTAKIMACAGMAFGFAVFCYSFAPSVPLALAVAAGFLACAAYVVSRPEVARQDTAV